MRPTNLDKAMTARLCGVVRCLSSTIGAAGSRRSRGINTRIMGRRRCGAWAADCASETRLERFFVLPSLLTEVGPSPRQGGSRQSRLAPQLSDAHGLGRIVLCE